jgi:RNA polymerase sigma-70 factor (ECF subfamily)
MNQPLHTDEWWMGELAAGKREALEPLLRRYAVPLLTFIQHMTGDRHRSEELFQEVFLAVWNKRRQFCTGRPFKAWLYAIAVNQCRAAFRRPVLATAELDEGLVMADGASPPETAIATETAAIVAQAVTLLPAQQRTVVVLRVWQQMSYGEIAEVLGTSDGTVRAHMHHGLCALRKYLEPKLSN